jgi:glycopeptide antibiotics resistance protein
VDEAETFLALVGAVCCCRSLVAVDDATPKPGPAAERGVSTHLLIDLAGNVVVFAPLGAVLSLALRDRSVRQRLLLATLGGAGLSLVIELIQTTIPSRVTALDDWLLNTGGAFFGALAGCVVCRRSEIGD